jgi:hypothetical protein
VLSWADFDPTKIQPDESDMTQSDYDKFRKLFMNLKDAELSTLIAPKTRADLSRLCSLQEKLASFERTHGNPTLLLRKNPKDMAVYTPLVFAHGGLSER